MKKPGKIFGVLLVVALLSSVFVGCSNKDVDQPNGNEGESGEKVLKIAYIPPTHDTADFYGQFSQGLWMGLDEAGISYEKFVRSPANHEAHEQQLAIVEDMIAMGVDYIVLAPSSYEALQPAYQKINEAGIPLIIGNYSDPFPEDFGATALSYVGYSHADGGRATAEYISENYPEGTKMAIIHGVPGYITEERGAKTLHEANGMDVVTEQYANFDRAQAFDAAQRILAANPDVKIIQANNSMMAIGAMEAVIAEGRIGEIDIFGAGGILEELDAIVAGTLKGTWYRDPLDMGIAASEGIIKHMEGREDEITESFNVKITMIDSLKSIVEYVNPSAYVGQGRDFPTLD